MSAGVGPAGREWCTDQSLKDITLKYFVKLRTYMQMCTYSYDFQYMLNHHHYVAFCDFILLLIAQKLEELET